MSKQYSNILMEAEGGKNSEAVIIVHNYWQATSQYTDQKNSDSVSGDDYVKLN